MLNISIESTLIKVKFHDMALEDDGALLLSVKITNEWALTGIRIHFVHATSVMNINNSFLKILLSLCD